METNLKIRLHIEVRGIVQGVGFRPFVHNLAEKYGLTGFVTNTINGVYIEVEGANGTTDRFLEDLSASAPPLSEIIDINYTQTEPKNDNKFEIKKTSSEWGNNTLISPDVSICEDCLEELFDKNNRRYLYPFINCTNCGPRFTIIENIPYDRPNTTMKNFEICSECRAEYENPEDRRFHAQPNACPVCGPKVWLEDNNDIITDDNNSTFHIAAEYLKEGKILAVKGLGGFHLTVDAANEKAVQALRKRKNREAKPLAIMVPDKKTLTIITEFDEHEYQNSHHCKDPLYC